METSELHKEIRKLAVRRLERREYSADEVRTYLTQKKGVEPADADPVIAELVRERLIDDLRYARIVIREQVLRGKGPHYILTKLRNKGIAIEIDEVRQVILEASGVDEVETARRIVERRYPDSATDRSEAARAFQALVRRGFSFDTARQAIRTMSGKP
jgi:SOS response regulatory protein OraA/RecX